MTLFDITATLLALAALFGLINYHWLRLPSAIGLVVVALAASLAVMALDRVAPGASASPKRCAAGSRGSTSVRC